MAREVFRMPSGVPREVARLIRNSTRHIAQPGEFLSYENAFKLYDALTTYRADLQHESADALYRADHAKTQRGFERATERLHTARDNALRTDEALNRLERGVGREAVPSLAPEEAKPISFEEEEQGEEYFLPEEGALEAFIGVDYTGAAGYRHEKGKTSDVSFNAVLRWKNGQPITEGEAREALATFAATGTLPHGMECDAVSWAGWKGRTRHGDVDDLDNFRDVIASVGYHGVRVGLLKPDSL